MHGNLVCGPYSDAVWAVYELEMQSCEGRPRRGKIDLMRDLADAADGWKPTSSCCASAGSGRSRTTAPTPPSTRATATWTTR
jgi:hypothetical protein